MSKDDALRSPGVQHVLEELAVRRASIAREICAHVQDEVPAHANGAEDPEYEDGLFAAVDAILGYAFESIKPGSSQSASLPAAVIDQARRAARAGVGATVVLRRCVAGNRRLGELITEEADRIAVRGDCHELRGTQDVLLDRLLAAVDREYGREHNRLMVSRRQRSRIVRALVVGEPVCAADLAALSYEIAEAWHIGLIVAGPSVEMALDRLDDGLPGFDAMLPVPASEGVFWVWRSIASSMKPQAAESVKARLADISDLWAGIGDPRYGMPGWLQTHREASAALRAAKGTQRIVRYADEPLLMAALENETLRTWLDGFLAPLRGRVDGRILMRTLRAYLDAECNRSSAASILKQEVRRQAIGDRLRTIERLLGRRICTCLAELDAALCLEDIRATGDSQSFPSRTTVLAQQTT